MSSDVVICPNCRTNLQNSVSVAGQVVACPQCQTRLQMPPLAQPVAELHLPIHAELPPAVELPSAIDAGAVPGPGVRAASPLVQTQRRSKGSAPSVSERLKKKSNPLAIFFAIAIVLTLIGVGIAAFYWDRSETAKKQFAEQMIGNWELVPGQSPLKRWDFAFHSDRKLQMALGDRLREGRWKVTSLRGATGDVLINWADDAPQTLRIRFEGGGMRVELDGVGNFLFRMASL